jgi:hypothetical protein
MTGIPILREAEVELWDAVEYYESKAAGLGLDFQNEIENALEMIAAQPTRWPLRADGTRRYLVHRFPFLIVYTCEGDHIWILAFAHCKRNPDYWQQRI